MTRELNDHGRAILYADWLNMGGCYISNAGRIPSAEYSTITLGEIADMTPSEGRMFARFAAEHLNREDLTKPYERAKS